MAKLKVYFFSTQDNGCGKFRMWSPAAALWRNDLCEIRRSPNVPPDITVERAEEIFKWADVVYTQCFTSLWACSFFVATRDYYKKKLIVDLDDSFWDVHPMNIGNVNGKMFMLNDHFSDDPNKFWDVLHMTDEQWNRYVDEMDPNDKKVLSKPNFLHGTMLDVDGRKMFVKAKHMDARSSANFYLSHADAVTTTNPFLAEIIRSKTGQQNVHITPNCLDPREWAGEPPTRNQEEVWIGWSGSVSHYPDLLPLMPPMDALMKEHDNLRVQIMGSSFEYLFPPKRDAPAYGVGGYGGNNNEAVYYNFEDAGERWPGRMRFDKPSPIDQYCQWMRHNFQSDIAIAPLETNRFNNAKSELKWCEYSMLGVPTVASKFGPYGRAIRHGVDGLLCGSPRSWRNALESLIESPELRASLAGAARERVLNEYNADKQAYRWADIFAGTAGAVPEPAQEVADVHAI